MLEQEIISKYFSRHSPNGYVELGIGDDAAVVIPPPNSKLVITTDTLNEGVHFFSDGLPDALGHKVLAVNLSDLAAMGAMPLWATINLSLSKVDHEWLDAFSNGLFTLADKYNIKIVGGDLVKGPLSISIQALGYLNSDRVLTRSGAEKGDCVFISGDIGDAALGLHIREEKLNFDISQKELDIIDMKFNKPNPRVGLGRKILKFASAAIDVSDGFLQDLKRITTMSKVEARIEFENIPFSETMRTYLDKSKNWMFPLTGGEDYELIFTANKKYISSIQQISKSLNIPITQIGEMVEGSGVSIYKDGYKLSLPEKLGFDHFG